MRRALWSLLTPRSFHCLPVLPFLLLLGLAARTYAQSAEGMMLTNEIRMLRGRLQWEQRDLSPRKLDELAYVLGRSNYLSRVIEQAILQNNFTRADQLLKEFPGTVNDIGLNYGQGGLLYQAVQRGADEAVTFLLAHKANPNRVPSHGEPPLFAAMRYQHWPTALRLVQAGAEVTSTNAQGQEALQLLFAYWWNAPPGNDPREELLTVMLEKGADPFAPIHDRFPLGLRPAGDPSCVLEQILRQPTWQRERLTDLLLTNRPSPQRFTPSGETALHLASLWGRTNVIQFLLEGGFPVDLTNSLGLTPLQLLSDATPPSMVPSARPGAIGVSRIMAMPGWGFSRPGLAQPASCREVAEFLLGHGATLDLFSAAGLGRTNELAALLTADRSRANVRDGCGRTPLHYAVSSLQLDSVRLLLRSGAALDVTNSQAVPRRGMELPMPSGLTPLHLAVERHSMELVRMLLQAGAPVSASNPAGETPLHLAARTAPTNLVALLLAAHATLDATNYSSETPLQIAAASNSGDMVELLLNAHASPTFGLVSNSLVHIAAAHGNTSTLTVLLRHHLPVDARDAEGRTPLERALEARAWDAMNLLQSKGADLNARDLQGNTPLHVVAALSDDSVGHQTEQSLWTKWKQDWLRSSGLRQQTLTRFIQWKLVAPPIPTTWTNTSLAAWLLQHGANPNVTNAAGQTPLYVFCAQSRPPFADERTTNSVVAFLQAGARVELADPAGLSSLHVAATNASPAVITLLARSVAHPERLRDAQGRTPVHYAARASSNGYDVRSARLQALLAGGLSIDAKDNQGRTALHDAVAAYSRNGWRQEDLLQTLLTNRANPNVQDAQGFTPLHQAMQAFAGDANYDLHEACLLLLTNRALPNLPDRQGRTPMHLLAGMSGPWAHPGGKLDDLLLNYPWNFAAHDHTGQTPVHLWCSNLDTSCSFCGSLLANILTNKALVNLTNSAGDTPLHVAIRAVRNYTVPLLLHAGANPAQRNAKGETAYRLAVEKWDPHWYNTESLYPAGANCSFFNAIFQQNRTAFDRWLEADPSLCSVTNAAGETSLQAATQHQRTGFAERLLALGAPLDLLSAMRLDRMEDFRKLLAQHQGPIPSGWLFEAVRFNRPEAAKALVGAGGDVHAPDGDGHSLANRAQVAHLPDLDAWFRAQGCRDTIFDAVTGSNHPLLEQFLADDPASVNATNAQHFTPLLAALAAGREEEVGFLLEHGANRQSSTPQGWSALHLAVANNLLEAATLLLHAGADPNQLAAQGIGPLHLAAALGRAGFAELLLTNGADVNLCPPNEGGSFRNSPLHWAAHRGGPEVVKVLLAHGADPTAPNGQGATPADLSRRPGSYWFITPGGLKHPFPKNLSQAERTEVQNLLKEAEARAASSLPSARPPSS